MPVFAKLDLSRWLKALLSLCLLSLGFGFHERLAAQSALPSYFESEGWVNPAQAIRTRSFLLYRAEQSSQWTEPDKQEIYKKSSGTGILGYANMPWYLYASFDVKGEAISTPTGGDKTEWEIQRKSLALANGHSPDLFWGLGYQEQSQTLLADSNQVDRSSEASAGLGLRLSGLLYVGLSTAMVTDSPATAVTNQWPRYLAAIALGKPRQPGNFHLEASSTHRPRSLAEAEGDKVANHSPAQDENRLLLEYKSENWHFMLRSTTLITHTLGLEPDESRWITESFSYGLGFSPWMTGLFLEAIVQSSKSKMDDVTFEGSKSLILVLGLAF